MSIANNIDYGVLSRFHVPLGKPSELEVMLMSTVSAVPQCDESFPLCLARRLAAAFITSNTNAGANGCDAWSRSR